MNIGYACQTIGVPNTRIKNCNLKKATPDVLQNLIMLNLESLSRILDYNIQNDIKLFRVSSEIIPYGSHPINKLKWWEIFGGKLTEIGQKVLKNGLRISMHPGQYTVLNSTDEDVVARAVEDLLYHTKFMNSIGVGKEHKIVIHIGGIYDDKQSSINRFIKKYRCLDTDIKERLVIENDDRNYSINDVLKIGVSEGIPVIFDSLHHKVNIDNTFSENEYIVRCRKTWKTYDGPQKIHFSQQEANKRAGSHSSTIEVSGFTDFYHSLPFHNTDIMLEVKDKNLSAVKCINAISSPKIIRLEKEWSRYKYLILEHSPKIYNDIRQLLKDKNSYHAVEFYRLIDKAMSVPITHGNSINTALHIWGYVNKTVDKKTVLQFEKSIHRISQGGSTTAIKKLLWKLSEIQKKKYLLDSLYFFC